MAVFFPFDVPFFPLAALGLAAGAAAVIVAGTPIVYSVLAEFNLPPEWLNRLPEWHSLPVAVGSLLLAAASLTRAVLAPADPDAGSRPRT
jgi:hypothetical protein